jgi:hypothetical protein
MIGVAAPTGEREIACEFFELFKTPWEFYRPGERYDVVLCTDEQCPSGAAKLVLLYRSARTAYDADNRIAVKLGRTGGFISYDGRRLPFYGAAATFPINCFASLKEETSQEPMGYLHRSGQGTTVRIGYDLFQEVRQLLSVGQPVANAGTPTLEWHITLLRDLISRAGISLVEIPPVPEGHGFMACLTHDLDHPVLRNHCCDRTMFGFLRRATIDSLIDVCRGRRKVGALCRNWAAAGRLPFVYLGIAKDMWRQFDHYLELEAGLGSTYFVIPKKGYAGRQANGHGSHRRASRYAVAEIRPQLEKIGFAGCEVALHGLDAWLDSASGCEERAELLRAVGGTETGVRMHWLFFNEQSPAVLDQAGFSYDSSFGYNQTVGYRAGTAQAFKPLGAARLLELPLHIMDTALFFPNYLRLSEPEAEGLARKLIDEVEEFGGALTINWHDRSIAPERLWGAFYMNLLAELKQRDAWFPTASQAVSWFRKRRSAEFSRGSRENEVIKVCVPGDQGAPSPGLKLRVHRPIAGGFDAAATGRFSAPYDDRVFQDRLETRVTVSA